MSENQENIETCTVTIKNVPVQVRKLFKDIQAIDTFANLDSLYGEGNPEERPANLFTRLVVERWLNMWGTDERHVRDLKEMYGIELKDDPSDLQIKNAYNFVKKGKAVQPELKLEMP